MKIKNRKTEHGNNHRYLIDWVPEESDVISQMVYKLKSDHSVYAWKFYANEFTKQASEIEFKQFVAIVPIPGSKKSSTHSMHFASMLSSLTKLPLLDCLEYGENVDEQKLKSKKQRLIARRQLRLKTGFEQFTKDKLFQGPILFVDDILTTGQTFAGSRQALNQGSEATVLTLFYRQKADQS